MFANAISPVRALFAAIGLSVLLACSCGASAANSNPALERLIGQTLTLNGPFDLAGKPGPYILWSGEPLYLVARGAFTWGAEYQQMQGKIISVTGTLHFRHFEPRADESVAQPFDYFYFDAETAKIAVK